MGTIGRVTFKCAACGGETFAHPEKPEPDDNVTCAGCGATLKWADFQATRERAQHEIHQLIVSTFKRPK